MFLGFNALGNDIWASLISGPRTKYTCNGTHRALIQLQTVNDKRSALEIRVVLATGLLSLQEVT